MLETTKYLKKNSLYVNNKSGGAKLKEAKLTAQSNIFFVLNATLNQKVMLNYCSCMEEFNNCGTSSGWRQCAASIQMKKEWRKKCKYLIFLLAFPLPREFFFHLEGHIWILLVPRNDFQLKLPQRSCNIWTFTECTPPLSCVKTIKTEK